MSGTDDTKDCRVPALGHDFADPALIEEALSHRSLGAARDYERLEFLGDRVLGLAVAHWLYELFPDEPEGALNARLDAMVDRSSLAEVAREAGIGAALAMSRGEEAAGTRRSDTVLADAMEAAIGAVYLDAGFEAADAMVRRLWESRLERGAVPPKDPKQALQEWALARGLDLPRYEIVGCEGPDHKPVFTVAVSVEGLGEATAEGGSKRKAQQDAARRLLAKAEETA